MEWLKGFRKIAKPYKRQTTGLRPIFGKKLKLKISREDIFPAFYFKK
jgi:hypothetical protein